jgi:hypothetical protein
LPPTDRPSRGEHAGH